MGGGHEGARGTTCGERAMQEESDFPVEMSKKCTKSFVKIIISLADQPVK